MRKTYAGELLRVMSPALALRYPPLAIPLDVKLAFERLQLSELAHRASVPHAIEAPGRNSGVAARVLGITVTEPVLDQPEVLTLIGERIAARVAEHVGMHMSEARALASLGNEVVDRPADHLTAPFGDEEPGQVILAR